jgi:3',5'-cyclic AMP phosphodiesterase CpdA
MGNFLKTIFVHVSDIHFGQEKDGGLIASNDDAKRCLIEDARTEVRKFGGDAAGVIVTGDIAYSGKDAEYTSAGKWLAELTDAIGCERTDVQMVPGNHDIDRKAITNTLETILFAFHKGGEYWLDRHLDHTEDCKTLYGRFDAYKGFALDYRCDLDLNGGISKSAKLNLAEGRAIRFVRLNSAITCSMKDDEGNLILGARQRILPEEDGVEIVVLSHHPLSWFQDSDKARGFLRGRARVFISGHEHFPRLDVHKVEEGRDLMMLAAGATAPDEFRDGFTYKYNILAFEWDESQDALAVTINPRTWDESMARFKRDDDFMEGLEERQVLASPNFKKAPPPGIQKDDQTHAVPELVEEPSAQLPEAHNDSNTEIERRGGSSNTEDGVEVAEREIEPVEPLDPVSAEPEPTQDIRDLQIRFFQLLDDERRLAAFVAFGIIRNAQGRMDHAMERRLFRRAVRQGKAEEIEQMLVAAEIGRKGETA